jgi:hypothetical protein
MLVKLMVKGRTPYSGLPNSKLASALLCEFFPRPVDM